jgi:hypothetical protein
MDTPKYNLLKKILAVQSDIGTLKKEKKNGFFNSHYFDINQLLDQLMPLLQKNGLVFLQPLTTIDGKPALETIVIDTESGDQMSTSVVLPEVTDPQKFGSLVTYFRRYSAQSFWSLQAEDDDGNSASGNQPKPEVFTGRGDFTPQRPTYPPTQANGRTS